MDFFGTNIKWASIIEITLIVVILVLIIGCILQVIWIRGKLSTYDSSNLANTMNALNQQKQQLFQSSQSFLQVYSIIINTPLTVKANNVTTPEYALLTPLTTPGNFNVPYSCADGITSVSMQSNDVTYVVITSSSLGANQLVGDVAQGRVAYLMINSIMYLVTYDPTVQAAIQGLNNSYTNTFLLCLFKMISNRNSAITPDSTCTLDMLPFFGLISNNTAPSLLTNLNITNASPKEIPVHALGYLLTIG